jgi:hypothetical protein
MEPAFTASLNHWLNVLGEAKFVTFSTFAKCQLKETLNCSTSCCWKQSQILNFHDVDDEECTRAEHGVPDRMR